MISANGMGGIEKGRGGENDKQMGYSRTLVVPARDFARENMRRDVALRDESAAMEVDGGI